MIKRLNILNSSLPSAHVVAVFCLTLFLLAPCCLAVLINDEGLPRGAVSVPFNDLLPPLSDAEFEQQQTTATKTTTTTTPTTTTIVSKVAYTSTTATKRPPAIPAAPTLKPKTTTTKTPAKSVKFQQIKKAQFPFEQQQQQQQQKLQKKPQLQLKSTTIPALDLNPEVPPNIPQATEDTIAATSIKGSELKQAASAQHLQRVQAAQTQYQALQQQLQPQKQQLQKQQLQNQQLQQQQQISIDQLQQYLNPTTRRPSRGALPTLTPFPRHLK